MPWRQRIYKHARHHFVSLSSPKGETNLFAVTLRNTRLLITLFFSMRKLGKKNYITELYNCEFIEAVLALWLNSAEALISSSKNLFLFDFTYLDICAFSSIASDDSGIVSAVRKLPSGAKGSGINVLSASEPSAESGVLSLRSRASNSSRFSSFKNTPRSSCFHKL